MEVIKASAERQEASSSGGELLDCAQPGLNSSAISVGKKKMLMRLSCPEGSASFLRSNHHNDDLTGCPQANLLAFINTSPQKHKHSDANCDKGCCDN